MPIRSLLTASQHTTNLTNIGQSPDHGTATISRQKRRSEPGKGLSHLVSKFEILDSLSRQSKPLRAKKSNLGGGNDSTLELNRPPSRNSTVSVLSLSNQPTKDEARHESWGEGGTHKGDGCHSGEARVSLVAERRRLFEVNLGDVRRNAPADPHATSGRPVKQVPLLSKWQTLRARSPSPCMAQSQTALLSRPAIPNVSQRLAGYLPLSSTCPSLPPVQTGTQAHTLSECVQSCMQHVQLDEDWASVVASDRSAVSPTTVDGKQAQTRRHLSGAGEDELALDGGEETHAGVMASEAALSSRRRDEDDLTAEKRRSTPTVDEPVDDDGGGTATRVPSLNQYAEFGTMNMHMNTTRGIMTTTRQDPSNGDPVSTSLTRAHQSGSSRIVAAGPVKEKNVEAVAARFETSPKKQPVNPPRISNTIEHFESLISGDGSTGKHKGSIRLPKRLTASSSCHLSKPGDKIKMGTAESARRKFSNSWGPARFRKSRALCHGDEKQSRQPDEPLCKRPKDELSTDGTVKRSPRPRDTEQHWLGRFHNNKKMTTNHVAQVQIPKTTRAVASGRLGPKGPRPQPITTGHEQEGTTQSEGQPRCGADMGASDGHGGGSWRRRRRWVSRSSIPLVARADCALQQPKPIRVNEVRRLVSLCREKMTARKSRAQTF